MLLPASALGRFASKALRHRADVPEGSMGWKADIVGGLALGESARIGRRRSTGSTYWKPAKVSAARQAGL